MPKKDRIPERAAGTQSTPMPGGLTVPETPYLFSDWGRRDDSGRKGRRRAPSIEPFSGMLFFAHRRYRQSENAWLGVGLLAEAR